MWVAVWKLCINYAQVSSVVSLTFSFNVRIFTFIKYIKFKQIIKFMLKKKQEKLVLSLEERHTQFLSDELLKQLSSLLR